MAKRADQACTRGRRPNAAASGWDPPTTTTKEARTALRRSYDDQHGDGWHLLPQEIWRRLRERSGPQEVLSAFRERRAAPTAGRWGTGRRGTGRLHEAWPRPSPLWGSTLPPCCACSELDGRRIEVWWEKEKAWFPGLLEGYRARDGHHFIRYVGWSRCVFESFYYLIN